MHFFLVWADILVQNNTLANKSVIHRWEQRMALKTSATKMRTIERRAFLFEMRKAGKTLAEIAELAIAKFGDLCPKGYDSAYVCKDITRELDIRRSAIQAEARDMSVMEMARLDDLHAAIWEAALSGDDRKIEHILKIMEQRRRYVGPETPLFIELSGPGGGPIKTEAKTELKIDDDTLTETARILSECGVLESAIEGTANSEDE